MNGRERSNKQKAARETETQRCTCSVGSGLFSTAEEIVIRICLKRIIRKGIISIQ